MAPIIRISLKPMVVCEKPSATVKRLPIDPTQFFEGRPELWRARLSGFKDHARVRRGKPLGADFARGCARIVGPVRIHPRNLREKVRESSAEPQVSAWRRGPNRGTKCALVEATICWLTLPRDSVSIFITQHLTNQI